MPAAAHLCQEEETSIPSLRHVSGSPKTAVVDQPSSRTSPVNSFELTRFVPSGSDL